MFAPRQSTLTFDVLAHRLVRDLVILIHSGTLTERRLAGMVGISQPHLHNVINGARALTPVVADQLMRCLDWSLLDLVDSVEARALLERRQVNLAVGREIPLGQCGVGPGFSFPGQELGEIIIPHSWLARAEIPVATTAGEDSEMEGIISAGDILLVDTANNISAEIHEDALYVVKRGIESLARWVRFSSRGLYLASASNWIEPSQWTLVVKGSGHREEVIEGKIIALAQPPDGRFRPPVQPFASN